MPDERRGGQGVQIRLAGQRRVEPLEPPRGGEQERGRVLAAVHGERDLGTQQRHAGSLQLVQRPGLRGREQCQRGLGRAGLLLGLRSRQRASRPAGRVHGQVCGALQERGRRGESTARLRPPGGALELRRDLLVRPCGGARPVPCAAIGIGLGIGDRGQRPVRAPAFLRRRRAVGRRAYERVAEAHQGAELAQARGRVRGRRVDAQPSGRLEHQRRVADRLGRRDQHQPPGVVRQRLDPPPEAVLDPPGQRSCPGEAEPARQSGGRDLARELQQRQRVAARLGDEPVAHELVKWPAQGRAQQRTRIVLVQAADRQRRQPGQLVRAVRAPSEHQRRRLRLEATRHEGQRLRRRAVEPLRVVDQAHQRPLGRHLGQQVQHGQPDVDAIRRVARAQPERRPQRVPLRLGQAIEPAQHRPTQLVQPGEGQLHLGLHARRALQPASGRPLGDVLQQRRLAHPRLSVDDQRPALARPDGLQQPVEVSTLGAAAQQHGSLAPRRRTNHGADNDRPAFSSSCDPA